MAITNKLAAYILLGLEILIVTDIINSIGNPNLMDIAILASIVVIRIFISFFLAKEVGELEH